MRSKLVLAVICAALLLGPSSSPATTSAQAPAATLISRASNPVSARASAALGDTSRRTASIAIDTAVLDDPGLIGSEVVLDLFDDTSYRARFYSRSDDGYGPVWKAELIGGEGGDVTLIGDRGRVSGSVRAARARYQVLATGRGRALVSEVDDAARLPDRVLEPTIVRTGARRAATSRAATSRIDLMVMFTAEAKKQEPPIAGGIKGLIRTAVADMNTDLANALVDLEVRLVKIKKVKYAKTGTSVGFASGALRDISSNGDGHMDKAHKLRDRFGADFVALIIERNSGLCGIAWVGGSRPNGLEDADEAGAFSVTTWRCLSFDTLAHEIGHNMGAQHSRLDPVSDTAGSYDYSYGHKVEGEILTVMAYNCASPCLNANAFSNPAVMFEGIAAGVPVGQPDPADNARAFNNDREVMAGYRPCTRNCDQ